MPVTTMTDRETFNRLIADSSTAGDVEEVHDYPGHESHRLSHGYFNGGPCPNRDNPAAQFARLPGCTADCSIMGPLLMLTTHRGLVLSLGELNGRDDSDFYAIVWDAAQGRPVEVQYATTRGWTYPNGASVDATPEVRAAYDAWRAARAAEERARLAAREAAQPRVGRTVRVVRGRRVPIGTVGRVFWQGGGLYGPRVGIETGAGERVFTAEGNVEVAQG